MTLTILCRDPFVAGLYQPPATDFVPHKSRREGGTGFDFRHCVLVTRRRSCNASLFFDSMMLACEAGWVVALRSLALSNATAAPSEVARMVAEKMDAAASTQRIVSAALLSGRQDGGMAEVVAFYRRSVRANRKRLSRK